MKSNILKTYAIILASGSGIRFGTDKPKQFQKLSGKMIIEHTLDVFEQNNYIDKIIIVVNPDWIDLCESILLKNNYKKVIKIIRGGKTRQESSYIGINSIPDIEANVLIHDAVRPLVSQTIISECVKSLKLYKAIDVAIPSADTIIHVNKNNIIKKIPNRNHLRRGQTPQAFHLSIIKKAHDLAKNSEKHLNITDDCGLVVNFNLAPVYVVNGNEENLKITHPIDLAFADKLFQLKTKKIEKFDVSIPKLNGKTIVIFGASKGIGAAIMQMALEYKAHVFGFSRSNGVDVTNIKNIQDALYSVKSQEGKIDYIINTVGVLRMGRLEMRDIDDINKEIQTNYISCIYIAQQGLKYLQDTKGSMLFYTSSSYTRGRELYSIYSSTKSAIVNFVQAIAEEWKSKNVRINAINPERTATPMRFENFGNEPKNTLLSPDIVAAVSLNTLVSNLSGEVIDIRKKNN